MHNHLKGEKTKKNTPKQKGDSFRRNFASKHHYSGCVKEKGRIFLPHLGRTRGNRRIRWRGSFNFLQAINTAELGMWNKEHTETTEGTGINQDSRNNNVLYGTLVSLDLAFLPALGLLELSTTITTLPLHFLLCLHPFLEEAGAFLSSSKSTYTPASSPRSLLPSSARGHLSARA